MGKWPPDVTTFVGPVTFTIPVKVVSLTNAHEHWRSRQKRAKKERAETWVAFYHATGRRTRPVTGPTLVTMTRVGKNKMDSDNLQGALKHVRDELAVCLGVDDRDPIVIWKCQQLVDRKQEPFVFVLIEDASTRNICPTCGQRLEQT
jgi:hypothetical protein